MEKTEPTCCSCEAGTMILASLMEIVGEEDIQKIARKATLPFFEKNEEVALERGLCMKELARFEDTLEETLGDAGAQGIFIQTGRVFFNRFYRKYGTGLGMVSKEYRMLPSKKRIAAGVKILADFISENIDVQMRLSEDETCWKIVIENQAIHQDQPVPGPLFSFFMWGLLQEYLLWAGGGKIYPVSQMEAGILTVGKKTLN